ncbi:unnamed protein product, partial [Medioppia subpectinata]
INESIVNRFGDYNYDCEVRYKSGTNGTIVTDCSGGIGKNITTQYNPKALILSGNDDYLLLMLSRFEPRIRCYNVKDKKLIDGNDCYDKFKPSPEELFKTIPQSWFDSIRGIVPKKTNEIFVLVLFYDIDGQPIANQPMILNQFSANINALMTRGLTREPSTILTVSSEWEDNINPNKPLKASKSYMTTLYLCNIVYQGVSDGIHTVIGNYPNVTDSDCGVSRESRLLNDKCFTYHKTSGLSRIANGRDTEAGETSYAVYIEIILYSPTILFLTLAINTLKDT